jgi:hypothetical protein
MIVFWMLIDVDVPVTVEERQHRYRNFMSDTADMVEMGEIVSEAAEKRLQWGDLRGLITWVAIHRGDSNVRAILLQMSLNFEQIADPDSTTIRLIIQLNRVRLSYSGYRRSLRLSI